MIIDLSSKYVQLLVQLATILPRVSSDKGIKNSKTSYILQKVLVENFVLN